MVLLYGVNNDRSEILNIDIRLNDNYTKLKYNCLYYLRSKIYYIWTAKNNKKEKT